MTSKRKTTVRAGHHQVTLSNLDKVFYPKTGFTKGDVISYYREIAQIMLPHVRRRPMTLKRYVDGVDGDVFYEKRCPPYRPAFVNTVKVRRKRDNKDIDFCTIDNTASLLWAANLASIELHSSLSKATRLGTPSYMVFDLDPGAPADVVACAGVAVRIRDVLDERGLEAFCKTSGSKGLQLFVPLNTKVTYERTAPFAHGVAKLLEDRHPELVVSRMAKELRPGKVFIDWSQNDDHKTTASVYSLRAKDRPTASTPVTWDEVERAVKEGDAALLTFEADEVLERVDKDGDLFEPVRTLHQKLPSI